MQLRMAITYAFVLALGSGVYAASAQMTKTAETVERTPSRSHGVPLRWVPDWLVKPLSRAIADATDPRQRSKATGAPLE